jgi:hypothetical protein
LIDHVFDREERLAEQGLQTKLFVAEEKNRVWQRVEEPGIGNQNRFAAEPTT